jgi:hypothetical protein
MNPQQNYPLGANGKLPGALVDAVADRVGRARRARLQRFARKLPVFAGTGNFNSLLGRKNSLLLRVGNFRAASSNLSSFPAGFLPVGAKIAEFPVFIPVSRERARSLDAPEAFAAAAG